MNSRAWAFAAMTALLLSTPTSLADEGEDEDLLSPLAPVTDVLEDACTSMLKVTLVSFGGTISEVDSQALDLNALVKGELHTTIRTITEVWHYPGETSDGLGAGDPIGDLVGPAFLELIETTETTVEEVDVPTPVHVEWSRNTIEWERVERTTLVPLPVDLDGVDPADIATTCDDASLQVEAPYYGEDYDVFMVGWWPEQFAPDTPEDDHYIRITDLTIGVEPDEDVEPMTLDQGLIIAPTEVEDAVLEALAEHAPVVHDMITHEDEDDYQPAPEVPSDEGEESEDAEASNTQSFQALPLAAKASVGGALGLTGLLGAVLALRRR